VLYKIYSKILEQFNFKVVLLYIMYVLL